MITYYDLFIFSSSLSLDLFPFLSLPFCSPFPFRIPFIILSFTVSPYLFLLPHECYLFVYSYYSCFFSSFYVLYAFMRE